MLYWASVYSGVFMGWARVPDPLGIKKKVGLGVFITLDGKLPL